MPYARSGLSIKCQIPGTVGGHEWYYDTTDAVTVVRAANYISDALAAGVRKGDLVHVRVWSALPTTNASKATAPATAPTLTAWQVMPVLGLSAAGAADLGDGTAIVVTNT